MAIAFRSLTIGAGDDDDELVAAVAPDGGAGSAEHLGDLHEHNIADLVAVGVVRNLQAIDVDHDHGMRDVGLEFDNVTHHLGDGGVVEGARELVAAGTFAFGLERGLQKQ